jgi:hypothetical protein
VAAGYPLFDPSERSASCATSITFYFSLPILNDFFLASSDLKLFGFWGEFCRVGQEQRVDQDHHVD